MTDLMTIRTRMGRLDNLTIGLCGDLKFGRTVHSLIKTMARCKNIRFVLISPEELRVPCHHQDAGPTALSTARPEPGGIHA